MKYRPSSPVFRSLPRIALGLLCALALTVLVPSSALAAAGGLRCEELSFDVRLSPSDATVYNVFGVLCSRGSLHKKTIQIALHGATYGHLYWDWPLQPETYSYVRRATAEGYAVLNINRIGIGQSDRPAGDAVTIESNAYVVHQIVQALRGGDLVVHSFGRIRADRVVLVGHSLGSVISIQEAATYGDVDGIVLTGVSHTVTPALNDVQFYPPGLDARFAGQGIPDGYFTTVPGTRGIFYYLPSVDPLVLALDEQTKETVTLGELTTAVPGLFHRRPRPCARGRGGSRRRLLQSAELHGLRQHQRRAFLLPGGRLRRSRGHRQRGARPEPPVPGPPGVRRHPGLAGPAGGERYEEAGADALPAVGLGARGSIGSFELVGSCLRETARRRCTRRGRRLRTGPSLRNGSAVVNGEVTGMSRKRLRNLTVGLGTTVRRDAPILNRAFSGSTNGGASLRRVHRIDPRQPIGHPQEA